MTTFLTQRRRARVAHTCEACGRSITAGEEYQRGSGFDGGTAWSWKVCAHCNVLLGMYPEVFNHDGEYDRDTFNEWATGGGYRDATEVRHAASWCMRWRTQRGTLLPIPARPNEESDDAHA